MRLRWALPAVLMLAGGWWFTAGTQPVDAAAAQDWQMPTMPWDQPPPEFKAMQQRGFHAGVKDAIKDFDHHRDPDVMRHKRYVHPKVDKGMRKDFRQGYRRGYDDAYKHLEKTNGRHS